MWSKCTAKDLRAWSNKSFWKVENLFHVACHGCVTQGDRHISEIWKWFQPCNTDCFQLVISVIMISGYGRPHFQYLKGKLPQPSKVFDNKRPNNRTSSNLTTKVGREKVCGADIKPFHTRGSVQLIKYRSPITPTRDDFVLSINVFLWPLQWLRSWATFSFFLLLM